LLSFFYGDGKLGECGMGSRHQNLQGPCRRAKPLYTAVLGRWIGHQQTTALKVSDNPREGWSAEQALSSDDEISKRDLTAMQISTGDLQHGPKCFARAMRRIVTEDSSDHIELSSQSDEVQRQDSFSTNIDTP
jgi:hypothetical protein